MPTFRTCIYCLEKKITTAFDREHVLSLAFGGFEGAPVLDCVCRRCNKYFGEELELQFARHSLEALLRYRNGIAPTPSHGLRFVDLTLPGPGDWEGARLRLSDEDGSSTVTLVPQVAFPGINGKGWIHVTEEEIDSGMLDAEPRAFNTTSVRVLATSQENKNSLLDKLATRGVTFKKFEPLEGPPGWEDTVEVEISFRINRGIRRSIAKYAFNFLAHTCGSDFVRARDFDDVRKFVRFGEKPQYVIVQESFRPILQDDKPQRRQTGGHLLTLNWSASGGVIGQVSLFNHTTYAVALACGYGGVWRPIANGLHFNIRTRSVKRMVNVSKSLLI